MPLRVRFVSRRDEDRPWSDAMSQMTRWKKFYLAPWLLLQHLTEIIVLVSVFIELIHPLIRSTFLIRSMFQGALCPDIALNKPFSKLEIIQNFVFDQFLTNLDKFINSSFANIYLVDDSVPYAFTILWENGTEATVSEINLDIDLFRHIQNLRLSTELYYVNPRSDVIGCSEWTVGTDITKSQGSYTFSAAPVITRANCRKEFFEAHIDIDELPQAHDLSTFAISLIVLSAVGVLMLVLDLVRRWKRHVMWRQADSSYRELMLYDQMHHSIGFWHPIHLVMEMVLVATAAVMIHEAKSMTQFISIKGLRMFAVGFFMTFWVACRWFNFSPKTYELVLIMRVSFTRLVNIFVGLLPMICGFMMIGLFLFGLVSDISRTYYRYLQLFFGLIFGDDMYGVYSYYTDGTDTYTYMAFVYVTAMAILAGYIFFPAFTATISFLRENEVIPMVEAAEHGRNH